MTRTEKKALLLQLIATNAATAGGFFTAHAMRMDAEKTAAKHCRSLSEQGVLFKVRTHRSTYGYFSTQALANTYQRQHRNDVLQRAATMIKFARWEGRPRRAAQAVQTVQPAHVQTRVYLTAPPRNQVTPLPSFIHNGHGPMR